jgi:hypothetical protein
MIALASSTYRLTEKSLEGIVDLLRRFGYLVFFASVVISLASMLLNEPADLAAQVMTSSLIAIFFIIRYGTYERFQDFLIYLLMLLLPVLAVTRTAIAVTILSPVISLFPMRLSKRIALIALLTTLTIGIFNLPQIQTKMFFSGSGEFSDLSFDNSDLATSGRMAMWDVLYAEAKEKSVFGHGFGMAETRSYQLSSLAYPHNDWLLIYYDLGILGVITFLFSNIGMMIHCVNSAKKTHSLTLKFMFLATASIYVPFLLLMSTDNIMVYASFFGNLHYMLMGLAYGSLSLEKSGKF